MKHITEQWNEKIYESAFWKFYFSGLKAGILDIETTGLNPAKNRFILGCIYDVDSGTMHQVLAENRGEEKEALAEYMRLLREMDVLVTYNGRHFDIPFLEKRTGSNVECYNLDIYRVLNGYSPIKKLVPNMKQKTIENYMGFWDTRADEISGRESVELFNHYEATGDPEAERKILLHNSDDVRQLTRLTKAVIKSDFHRAMFRQGFPVSDGLRLMTVKTMKLNRRSLEIKGFQNSLPVSYECYELDGWPVEAHFETGTGRNTFTLNVPLIRKDDFAIADLRAAGLEEESGHSDFADYPMWGNGFLVIEDREGIRCREANHFVKALLKKFMEEIF